MFAVKSKFMVGVATSVVATSVTLGASVIVTSGTAVDPARPPVVVVVVVVVVPFIITIPEPPSPPIRLLLPPLYPAPPPPPPVCF